MRSTFKVEMNNEIHQIVISGIGEQHLDIVCSKLKSKYGVSVNLTEPKYHIMKLLRRRLKLKVNMETIRRARSI